MTISRDDPILSENLQTRRQSPAETRSSKLSKKRTPNVTGRSLTTREEPYRSRSISDLISPHSGTEVLKENRNILDRSCDRFLTEFAVKSEYMPMIQI